MAMELWQFGDAKNVFLSIILHRFCKRKVHRITKIVMPVKMANMEKNKYVFSYKKLTLNIVKNINVPPILIILYTSLENGVQNMWLEFDGN